MRFSRKRATVFLILSLALVRTSQAGWVQTRGPGPGGYVLSLASNGEFLFAGTSGGIYRSADDGESWIPINQGLVTRVEHGAQVRALLVSGSKIYAGASEGVFLSTDNGDSWIEMDQRGGVSPRIKCLLVSGTHIFAGALTGGVIRSTDNGATWNKANNGLTMEGFEKVNSLAEQGGYIFAGTNTGGLFRSADLGETWEPVEIGSNIGVRALAVKGPNLYLNGVIRSADQGNSWERIDGGRGFGTVHCLLPSDSHLYVGAYSGIYRAAHSEGVWSQINAGLTRTSVWSLAVHKNKVFAGTDSGGVFRAEADGESWKPASNGLAMTTVRGLMAKDGNLFAGTDYTGIFRSSDKGGSWTQVNQGLISTHILSLAWNGSRLFAGTSQDGIFHSDDGGGSWTQIKPDSISRTISTYTVPCLAASDGILFAGILNDFGGVYQSHDNGKTWFYHGSGFPIASSLLSLAASDSLLFAGVDDEGVFRASKRGGAWSPILEGVQAGRVFALAVNGPYLFAGADSGLFRTADEGKSWTRTDDWPDSCTVGTLFASAGHILAGCFSGNMFHSADNGEHWTRINEGLTCATVFAFAIDGGRLYAGAASSGVWGRPLSELGISSAVKPRLGRGARHRLTKRAGVGLGFYDIKGRMIPILGNP